jgi:hypothetical protein
MPHRSTKGTRSQSELDDERVRADYILSNRDGVQRRPGRSLNSTAVQLEETEDTPNQRRDDHQDENEKQQRDRPGFDLGGSSGDTEAGKGLGLGSDAMDKKADWSPPRRAT